MQTIAKTCVRFESAHLSINLVSEIAVPMFPTLTGWSSLQLAIWARSPDEYNYVAILVGSICKHKLKDFQQFEILLTM